MMSQKDKEDKPTMGTGPGSSGEENADMDRDMTADAETEKSAEAPGNDPAKNREKVQAPTDGAEPKK